ncbi:MAG: AbrB/MazE/SpoVT family DNA-binding domain-containing protein [Oscillospiraceae bacterium]|nr:AbrB/MazE/SpoVT family DNA-binding domain-containing protein [Oscillospiraceae bacterium]
MKETGIVRKIDDLGRIVLPIELRKILGIGRHDPVEIFVDGNSIILKKHECSCIFCGSSDNLSEYKGKHVCATCAKNLSK